MQVIQKYTEIYSNRNTHVQVCYLFTPLHKNVPEIEIYMYIGDTEICRNIQQYYLFIYSNINTHVQVCYLFILLLYKNVLEIIMQHSFNITNAPEIEKYKYSICTNRRTLPFQHQWAECVCDILTVCRKCIIFTAFDTFQCAPLSSKMMN